jgi:nitrite reductase/ring-hydroxylating ferredoxin subunit
MVQLSGKVLKTGLFCFFILIGINGCKDDYTSVIPYAVVNENFNLANNIELNIPGGSIYIKNSGFGGLIIFRDLAESSNPFLAFDAACTYEVLSTVRVEVIEGSGLAKCPKCGSEFILFGGNGSPTKGPAVEPLKQYHTIYNGGRIIVSN